MSDTTINLCRNFLLKSVKMHFSGNTEIWGFKKSNNLFMGFRINFILKIGTLEIVKNCFRQKKMKYNFLKKNGIFDQKLQFLRLYRNS